MLTACSSLPRGKSVVRLIGCPTITIALTWDVKQQNKQTNKALLHTLYNVIESAPLLQEYATLLCSSPRLGSIYLVLHTHNLW